MTTHPRSKPKNKGRAPVVSVRERLRTSFWVTVLVAFALLLSSCGRRAPQTGPAPRGPSDADLLVPAGGYHGNHFRGPVYLPRSSPMADGTTAYSVTYREGVTVVSKDETRKHLVGIERDGSYLFDSSAAQIAGLQPGTVVLLSGLALCSVTSVEKTGDKYLLKHEAVKLTDAIEQGRLEGVYQIDFNRMQHRGASDFDVNFGGYNYHVQFTPERDRIGVRATIRFAGPQGALAYEGVGYLSNFVSRVKMKIENRQVTDLSFTNSGMSGQVELKWFALANSAMNAGSVARITSWPAVLLKNAPLGRAAYHVPILVGPVPFDLKISLGFSFIPVFSSQNSVVEGRKSVKFRGSGGFVLADGQSKPAGTLDVEVDVDPQQARVEAAGPVGFTAATEAPRVDLGLGWPPAPSQTAGYLNFVTSYGIVTNGSANPPPCQTNVLGFSVNAGPADTSPDSFADWVPVTGSSTPLWQKTLKSPGVSGLMCSG
jgi:hypothetical protein